MATFGLRIDQPTFVYKYFTNIHCKENILKGTLAKLFPIMSKGFPFRLNIFPAVDNVAIRVIFHMCLFTCSGTQWAKSKVVMR